MSQKITVLTADDHTLFRKGTVMMLKTFREVGQVLEANNGQEALDVIKDHPVDILLLDLEMPVMDGWETSKRVLTKHPDIHIIMLSMHDSLSVISDMIEMGVHSYLLKNSDPEEVHRAIVSAVNHEFYYNNIIAKALHEKVKAGGVEKPIFNEKSTLTKREVEILQLICQELTMREIGDRLFLSEQTVHTHRKNLMKKTKVKNAVGLVKYAIQHRIVTI